MQVEGANGTLIHRSNVFTSPHIYRGKPTNGTFLCDSFVTFTHSRRLPAHDDTDCTIVAPDFSLGQPSIAGSWLCAAGPRNLQVAPASVLLLQAALPLGGSASVRMRIYGKGARSCVATAVMEEGVQTASFGCEPQPDINVTLPVMPLPKTDGGGAVAAGVAVGVLLAVLLCRRRKARSMEHVHLADRLCEEEDAAGAAAAQTQSQVQPLAPPPALPPRRESKEGATATTAATASARGAEGVEHAARFEQEDTDLLKYEDFM